MDYIGFGSTPVADNVSHVKSRTVQDFAKTCVEHANSYSGIKQAAFQEGWRPSSRAYLLLNGFQNISGRQDILRKRGSKVLALKKRMGGGTSVLLFYKMKYRNQFQVKCELYTNTESRERVFASLNTLINKSPLRNNKTKDSHLSVWQLRKRSSTFTVRYLYEYNADDLLDFNGVMMWTHYS